MVATSLSGMVPLSTLLHCSAIFASKKWTRGRGVLTFLRNQLSLLHVRGDIGASFPRKCATQQPPGMLPPSTHRPFFPEPSIVSLGQTDSVPD
jgi:hypothetical protein